MILHRREGDSNARLQKLAFCTLWATGPDTTLDGVFRIQAIKRTESGTWASFDRFTRPFEKETADVESATLRMRREYGVTGEALADAPHARDVWEELSIFLAGGPVIVLETKSFEAWFRHLAARDLSPPLSIGLVELAALTLPGRLSNRREELVHLLAAAPGSDSKNTEAFGPEELQAATRELLRRFLESDARTLELAACGYGAALEGLRATDPNAAERLALALELLDQPSAWGGATPSHLPLEKTLEDGRVRAALAAGRSIDDILDGVEPRCAEEGRRWSGFKALPPGDEDAVPLDDADRSTLDDIFQVHLPALFGGETLHYRATQHAVAREVSVTLGGDELLLVHAPTGTGKTLAYLVPALLWARKNDIRIGVATYTRALQEQAADREVPRALQALSRAGMKDGCRVSVLKGRENYLCWRALILHAPTPDDDAELWLAWTTLALFASFDLDGDLNRFPLRPPVALESSQPFGKVLGSLVAKVRSRTGCCSVQRDRTTCAAEVARRRAERSHVVITNHSFALARQEFFKHVIFDECEHLHDQAHNAWSHTLRFAHVRALLERIHKPRSQWSRAALDRLDTKLMHGTKSRVALDESLTCWTASSSTLDELERAVDEYRRWRDREAPTRQPSEQHGLFREYFSIGEGDDLIEARQRLSSGLNHLDSALAVLCERLDAAPFRGVARIRYMLERARNDLSDVLLAIEAWLPLVEGEPVFLPRTFYDVEEGARGETVLAARVLLPNEFLGRHYYPQLASAAFLSATTWLKNGFDAAAGYLGLERAAHPADDEEREARVVRTFKAPDVFDYGRVLVCVPRDAPSPSMDKSVFLDYVRRFVAHLAERTRGRMLVLFTNANDVTRVGEGLTGFFRARKIPLWFQNMRGTTKEELSELFRAQIDSTLLGVDTFWYGADFPGETLEYLVIVRLPYGVPDRYHHAQCAALGVGGQRKKIYLPRALAKLRQGFGRLMRKETDKGCVFLLDGRILSPRHRAFLEELPLQDPWSQAADATEGRAELVRGDTDTCIQRALAHMGMLTDVRRRGLDDSFAPDAAPARELREPRPAPTTTVGPAAPPIEERVIVEPPEIIDVPQEDLPF